MDSNRERARRLNIALYALDAAYYSNENRLCMNSSEICLLYALDDGGQHTQKQICEDWLIPRTTLNTIIKQWERLGYIGLSAIPGKRREMAVALTEAGRQYARPAMDLIYRAEEAAMEQTVARYSPDFIEALEFFTAALRESFNKNTDDVG